MSRERRVTRQMSHAATSAGRTRDELAAAFDREARRVGTMATLHNHAIADLVGLHQTDHECLDLLDWAEPLTAGEIATHLGLTSGAVTGLIDRLEAGGWVRRERDPKDRRRVFVHLADIDEPALWEAYRPLAEAIETYREALSDRDLRVIVEFLEATNDIMSDATEHARRVRRDHRGT